MSDLIDRQALKNKLKRWNGNDPYEFVEIAFWAVDNAPTIDAAAAIEALQAQLPKRGKWITHPEVKNIYGGVYIECPFCGEKYVVQNVSDEKFCRNCGADLRAKMEVQE